MSVWPVSGSKKRGFDTATRPCIRQATANLLQPPAAAWPCVRRNILQTPTTDCDSNPFAASSKYDSELELNEVVLEGNC